MTPFLSRPIARLRVRSLSTLMYRGLVLGLLAAIALLLTSVRVGAPPVAAAASAHDAIVDVSRRAAGDGVVELLGLDRGERVIAIDDAPAATDAVVDAWRLATPGEYLDLTVAGSSGGSRRVLVLVHP